MPAWQQLQKLLSHAGTMKAAEEARQQASAIVAQRLLLATPDPITPLVKSVENTLRKELTTKHQTYSQRMKANIAALATDDSWSKLNDAQQSAIRSQCDIGDVDDLKIGTQDDLVAAMQAYPITSWDDRIDALNGRFARARERAAKELEPKTQTVEVPKRTLKTEADIAAWLEDAGKLIRDAVAKGPVVIR